VQYFDSFKVYLGHKNIVFFPALLINNITNIFFCLFQHIVFALKFILAYIIPDVPREIQLASRKVNIFSLIFLFRFVEYLTKY